MQAASSQCTNKQDDWPALQLGTIVRDTLQPGCTAHYRLDPAALAGTACSPENSTTDTRYWHHASQPLKEAKTLLSFLVFEYWRVDGDSPVGDGLMVASKGVPAQGSFQDGAQSLTLTTLHSALPLPAHLAHADWANFEIGRPFQMLNVPVERGAWAGLHAWFVGVQNVAVWAVGNVTYTLRCGAL